MNFNPALIAAAAPPRLDGVLQPSKTHIGEVFIMLGAVLVLTVAIFIWAAFFRKPPRRHHSHHHEHHWNAGKSDENSSPAVSHSRPRFRFWRRHRQRHRKRPPNPTLAETGGLPPTRAESQSSRDL
jgi:hypothetical protein